MSKKGTSTFAMQRATAVLVAPLAIWFLWSLVAHAGGDYETARKWLSKTQNAVLLGALIVIGAAHMRIGVKEVIDDYIHGSLHGVLSWLNWLASLAVIGVTLWSVYTVAF